MKIAVIDGSEMDNVQIVNFISEYSSMKNIECKVEGFCSAETFFESYEAGMFDIIFLDIYLSGQSGIDAAFQMRRQKETCHIVFVSSSVKYAVTSYDVQATYYIVKPLHYETLVKAMNICLDRISDDKCIEVISNRQTSTVPLKTLVYAETYQNSIILHTTIGTLKTYMTFHTLLNLLESESRFLYCYKGCVVNMDYITEIEKDCFVMYNNRRVPIRKRKQNYLKNEYTNYLLKKIGTWED